MKNFKFKIWFLLTLICAGQLSWGQFKIPPTPKTQTSVYDYVNLLSVSEKAHLEQKLIQYSDSTSTQIVVATIASTDGEYINYLATNWAHRWGIGQNKEDNGVFILLAKDDRKINISTGYGVEHLLTDKICSRIIQDHMIPYFKQNQYAKGLEYGTDAIFQVLNGTYSVSSPTSTGFPFELIILIIVFIILIVAFSKRNKGPNKGRKATPASLLDYIILSNMGRGSYQKEKSGGGIFGSGGSFGGGGFSGGFGGGGFGGGGASGGW